MKATEVIKRLQELIEEHGDKPVSSLLSGTVVSGIEWYDENGNQQGEANGFVASA